MDAELCREIFVRGCASCDLAIIEGCFAHHAPCGRATGGTLSTLCEWLDLPRLAIVDAASLGTCQLPERPAGLDGLLLDRVCDAAHAARLQTLVESLWNVPVIAWLGTVEGLRSRVDATPLGCQPPLELCHALGGELTRHANLDRVFRISRRKFPAYCARSRQKHEGAALRVAVAYDDAFHCYFPDTLDLLELKGATVSDFSPLRDDRLPPATNVIYLGCGRPESFAEQLSGNDCMILALKSHLSSGGRIYAEGGGLAYLCQRITLCDGQSLPMVGAFAATAHVDPFASPPEPAEMTVARNTWMGEAPMRWTGYLNQRWRLATGSAVGCGSDACHATDVVGQHQAIGSRLHMNFAAREDLLDRFFQPHSTCGRPG